MRDGIRKVGSSSNLLYLTSDNKTITDDNRHSTVIETIPD